MKRIALICASFIAIIGLWAAVATLLPVSVLADAKSDVCSGVGAVSGGSGCTDPAGAPNVTKVINAVVNVLSIIGGVLAVIMIIFAGFRYVTSAGDSSKISGAKNTLIYAIVGIIVIAMAQFIVKYVVGQAAK